MIRRPPRSTQSRSSAASDVYKRQGPRTRRRRAARCRRRRTPRQQQVFEQQQPSPRRPCYGSDERRAAEAVSRLANVHYVNSLLDLVGNTPLLRLSPSTDGAKPLVLAKVEHLNPGGSVKDRIALRMVEAAERDGSLKPGGTIVEPTSGNTGVGLAMVAQAKGYTCVFVCPDKVGLDKINVLKAYGAEVVVCPTAVAPDSPDSYYSVSDRLVREIPKGWKPNQYANLANAASHYATTGPEIWADTDGLVTHFVTGVGTGGTITGTGRYLKEVSADRAGGPVRIIGADPEGSVYSGGSGRPY